MSGLLGTIPCMANRRWTLCAVTLGALGCNDSVPLSASDASAQDVSFSDSTTSRRDGAVGVHDVGATDVTDATVATDTVGDVVTPADMGAAQTTWAEHVAPVVFQHCAGCHREGGIAPFSLLTYEDAAPRAELMRNETTARRMPPSVVNASGSCNTFRDDVRWLSQAEIDVFARWADDGAPSGDLSRVPPAPSPPSGLARTDLTLDMGVSYTPDAMQPDDYRCFLVDPGLSADRFITGFEVIPGDSRVVHHLILYSIPSERAEHDAEALDARDATPGYPCFGGPRVGDSQPLALWAPGGGATSFPARTGLRLSGGRKAVLQVHYNTLSGTHPDRSRVHLQLENSVFTEAYLVPYRPDVVSLPPRMTSAVASDVIDIPDFPNGIRSVWVHGVAPHMHTLGRTLRVDAVRNGDSHCMVDVPNWNFHWQQLAFYQNPVEVFPGTQVSIRCTFDTTTRTTTTTWGEGTQDEMCLSYFYVTPLRPPR